MSRGEVAALWALQQLDVEVDRLVIEAESLARALANDVTRDDRLALHQGMKRAAAAASAAREAEAALAETQERLKRQEARLYGGSAGPKELGALQQEIAHLQATRMTQEESALAALMASEEAQAAVTPLERALARTQREQEVERGRLTTRQSELDASLAELRARRAQQAQTLGEGALARYEGLRRSRAGKAVAEVRGGVCQACRVSIQPATLQRARAAAELVTCGNCGRILYVP
jgi:predicted  nucleic acid-binding Zn-ribbon protein